MKTGYTLFLGFCILWGVTIYGQDRVIEFSFSKPSPTLDKSFSDYHSDFRGGLKYYQFWRDNYIYGGGIESMNFRKSDLPSRTLKLIHVFAMGGYQFDLDGKVRILSSMHLGISKMDFGFEKSSGSSVAKASDKMALMAGANFSAIVPFSAQFIIEPELGFVSIFHKLDGYKLKDSKGQPVTEKTTAPIGIWIYRIGLGYRF